MQRLADRRKAARLLGRPSAGLRAICLDAFNADGETPAHLLRPGFLRACAAALGEGGVVAQETSTGVGDQVVEPEAAALCGDAVRASLGILWQMKLPVAALHARWIPGARGEV